MGLLASGGGRRALAVAAALLLVSLPAPRAAAESVPEVERTRLRIVLAPSDDSASVDVSGLSFGLLADRARNVAGLQLGLAFLDTTKSLAGLQLGVGFNFVDGEADGAQVTGLANFSAVARGGQLAIGINHAEQLRGVQVGIANSAGDGWGAQLGAMNSSRRFLGGRIGAVNGSEEFEGVEVGLLNFDGSVKGFQLGLLNLPCLPLATDCAELPRDTSGVSIGAVNVAHATAGLDLALVNVAREARGLHIGLVNLVWNDDGESLALLNLTRTGVHEVALYATDSAWLNTDLKLGSKHLFTVMTASFKPGGAASGASADLSSGGRRISVGLGLGWRFPIEWRRVVSLETELSASRVRSNGTELAHAGPTLYELRLVSVLRIIEHASLIGGLGLGLTTSGATDQVILGHLATTWTGGDRSYRLAPEILAGIQL